MQVMPQKVLTLASIENEHTRTKTKIWNNRQQRFAG